MPVPPGPVVPASRFLPGAVPAVPVGEGHDRRRRRCRRLRRPCRRRYRWCRRCRSSRRRLRPGHQSARQRIPESVDRRAIALLVHFGGVVVRNRSSRRLEQREYGQRGEEIRPSGARYARPWLIVGTWGISFYVRERNRAPPSQATAMPSCRKAKRRRERNAWCRHEWSTAGRFFFTRAIPMSRPTNQVVGRLNRSFDGRSKFVAPVKPDARKLACARWRLHNRGVTAARHSERSARQQRR